MVDVGLNYEMFGYDLTRLIFLIQNLKFKQYAQCFISQTHVRTRTSVCGVSILNDCGPRPMGSARP